MRRTVVALAALAIAAASTTAASTRANAHGVDARLSTGGVEYLQQQLPTYVPTYLAPPAMTMQIADPCPGATAITFTQQNTDVYLNVDDFDLSLPQAGVMRVDLTLSADAWGDAYIDNPYLCFGSADCNDTLSIYGARAVIDFQAWVDESGKPRVYLSSVDLQLSPDDVYFALSDCAIDDLVNLVVDFGKGWAIDMLKDKVEVMAQEQLAPKLEEMLAGFSRYDGVVGSAKFTAGLTDLDIKTSGIALGADIDLYSNYAAAACIAANDPGDPATHPAPAPSLEGGVDAHVGVTVNLGLVNDALYHVWREGFLCITPETLAAFGIDLDLSKIGAMMPGFPDGTVFSLDAIISQPPYVEGVPSENAELTLHVDGAEINLVATLPDATTKTLHLSLDAAATASVILDPGINALSLAMGAVAITRMDVMDGLGLEEAGFDYAQVKQLLEERVMPHMAAQFGEMPVTGPIFGGVAGYYVILRQLRTANGWLLAKADLFRAPENDFAAPDTYIDQQPSGPVRPIDAAMLVRGTDAEVPAELLRFAVTVDGAAQDPTWVRTFKVGEDGKTAVYHVQVSAMDLAGNVDPTPAYADVTVDGVLPAVSFIEHLLGEIPTATPSISWTASDDLTPAEQLSGVVEVYQISASRVAELKDTHDVNAGETAATLTLEPGAEYRVIVRIRDEAGNTASKSMMFTVSADATDPTPGCGCDVGGRSTGSKTNAAAGLLLLAAGLLLRRRFRA